MQYVDIRGCIHCYRALSLQLGWAWNEVMIMDRFFPLGDELQAYKKILRQIMQTSNGTLLGSLEDLSHVYSEGRTISWTAETVEKANCQFLDDLQPETNPFG